MKYDFDHWDKPEMTQEEALAWFESEFEVTDGKRCRPTCPQCQAEEWAIKALSVRWHKVKSRKDLPEMYIPVIVEYDRGITVAILDDAWVKNQPMWYVNNEPIGLWNAVDRWMEIPR